MQETYEVVLVRQIIREMNCMDLREMDRIIYPVCNLFRDYEKAGFVVAKKSESCVIKSYTDRVSRFYGTGVFFVFAHSRNKSCVDAITG